MSKYCNLVLHNFGLVLVGFQSFYHHLLNHVVTDKSRRVRNAKPRRCVSWIYFTKIHFGKIHPANFLAGPFLEEDNCLPNLGKVGKS